MSEILNRFSFQAASFNAQVIACVVTVWIAVIWCTIISIFSQPFTRQQRIFWITIVVALPIVGLLAYLPFSFRREDLPHIFLTKKKDRPKKALKPSDPISRSGGI